MPRGGADGMVYSSPGQYLLCSVRVTTVAAELVLYRRSDPVESGVGIAGGGFEAPHLPIDFLVFLQPASSLPVSEEDILLPGSYESLGLAYLAYIAAMLW